MKKRSIFQIITKRKITISIAIFLGMALAITAGNYIFYHYFKTASAADTCVAGTTALTISSGVNSRIVDNVLSGSSNSSCNGSVSDYDITVTGPGVKLTLGGFNTFKSVNIINNATVTHDAIVPSTDIATGDAVLNDAGEKKKVQMQITGALTLDTGGKIDVSGLGYPGGTLAHPVGYGYGGGQSTRTATSEAISVYGAGGGGFGNKGGDGKSSINAVAAVPAAGGIAYPNFYDAYYFRAGSGAGYNFGNVNLTNSAKVGSAGGGRIYIHAGTINIKSGTITAKGNDGSATIAVCNDTIRNRSSFGAGGAGGTIWLSADTIISPVGSLAPNVSGGLAGNDYAATSKACASNAATPSMIHDGANGLSEVFVDGKDSASIYANYFSTLSVAGGAPSLLSNGTAAGGGAGGRIRIDAKSVRPSCAISSSSTPNDKIPAECEGGDVTINSTTIKMDAIQIDKDSRQACSAIADPNCDTIRHFNSLTLLGSAKLTIDPISTADLNINNIQFDTLKDAALNNGKARWRKVDIIVDGEIKLSNASQIDVTGDGYAATYGRAAGGANQGGSFAGAGGGNISAVYPVDFQSKMIANNFDYTSTYTETAVKYPLFDAGSGAGSASAGGGRIHLSAKTISVDQTAAIKADGASGAIGGAGGMIWLDAQTFNFSSSLPETSVSGGTGTPAGSNGYIYADSFVPSIISANGGTASTGGGGGGGRIILHMTVAQANQPIITKTSKISERPGATGTAVTDLNPYALMLGDKVLVNIAVSGLNITTPVPVTVEDDFLTSQTGVYCGAPTEGPFGIVDPTSAQAFLISHNTGAVDKITWTFTPILKNVTMSYICEVRKP